MTKQASHRFSSPLLALAGAVLATLLLALALSAPSASASGYCGGKVLSNYGICYGAERSASEVQGYGTEKSVCVGLAPISGKCSSGPYAWASDNYGTVYYTSPWIQDNAAGRTEVFGEAF